MPTVDGNTDNGPERLFWTRSVSLTTRILAVNVIALGLLAGSLFYLDNCRNQLLAERFRLARTEAEVTADGLAGISSRKRRRALVVQVAADQQLRLRLYDAKGRLQIDSFQLADPTFTLGSPDDEPWFQNVARSLDRGMDMILGSPPIPDYVDSESKKADAWPEVLEAASTGKTAIRQRLAPDHTPVITAAAIVGKKGEVLLATRNATDITMKVRDARQTLAIIVGAALAVSIQLSLFLARTIVMPLRLLVRAAVFRVQLGRDREVVVPRLPERRDEIGLLARALSDMSAALQHRIDAVESFAADVAHEIKNPLASLRSALESLDRVEDRALRRQLADIAAHDIRRIDRLITEISDASRIDAELSRTTFEPVDMQRLVKALVAGRESRAVDGNCAISVARSGYGNLVVPGDPSRLERVLNNLLDNAVSFSPEGGAIEVELIGGDDRVAIWISDHGPGIPAESRERVFERFHSLRPDNEDFGGHSGLGLAIARTIVEAHDGTLTACSRADGNEGARLVIDLPAWRNK